jgi:hypothetical protein
MKKPRTEITNQTAKFLLNAYRPNGADAQDPVFRDALEQATRDPELGAWFKEQRGFDSMIAEKLSGIEPPATLRSAILAGIENRPPVRHFSIRPLFALAAVIALCAVFLVPMLNRRNSGRRLVDQYCNANLSMLAAVPAPQLDLMTASFSRTQEYLAEMQAPCIPSPPAALLDLPTAGCKTLRWNGHILSLTCFRLPGKELLHVFVIAQEAFDSIDTGSGFQEINGWHVKFELLHGMLLMFVSRASMAEIKQYI